MHFELRNLAQRNERKHPYHDKSKASCQLPYWTKQNYRQAAKTVFFMGLRDAGIILLVSAGVGIVVASQIVVVLGYAG
jgi:hypothetical protein